jgi:hypothetical protein
MKLTELTAEELEDLSLVDFQKRMIQEVRERWVDTQLGIPNENCIPYKEDDSILFVYSSGAIIILEAGECCLISGDPRDILCFSYPALSAIFSEVVIQKYKVVLEKSNSAKREVEKERMEKREREQFKYLSEKYG